MALVDEGITWFIVYLMVLIPTFFIALVAILFTIKSLIQKGIKYPKTHILLFCALSSSCAFVNNALRLVGISAFETDRRHWVLVLFIYIFNYLAGIFNFDAHMRLVMLWASLYHTTFNSGDKAAIKRVVDRVQLTFASILHVIISIMLFLSIVLVSIGRILYGSLSVEESIGPENKFLLANPGIVYGTLVGIYLLLSLGMVIAFCIYGGMLVYRIKNSPLKKSTDIRRLTVLTTAAVVIHAFFVTFMVLGIIGILVNLNDAAKQATKHIWPLIYLLASSANLVSTFIMIVFFGMTNNSPKRSRASRGKSRRFTSIPRSLPPPSSSSSPPVPSSVVDTPPPPHPSPPVVEDVNLSSSSSSSPIPPIVVDSSSSTNPDNIHLHL